MSDGHHRNLGKEFHMKANITMNDLFNPDTDLGHDFITKLTDVAFLATNPPFPHTTSPAKTVINDNRSLSREKLCVSAWAWNIAARAEIKHVFLGLRKERRLQRNQARPEEDAQPPYTFL